MPTVKRGLTGIVLLALVWAGSGGAAAETIPSPGDALVVVNQDDGDEGHDGSVTFLHPESYAPLAHVEVGIRPIWAGYGPGRRHLYVLNSGKGGMASPGSLGRESSLTVIDTALHQRVASIDLVPFARRVVLSPKSDAMYVLSGGKKDAPASVQRIDLETHQITGSIAMGNEMGIGAFPERQLPLFSPSGRLLFVLRSPPPLSSNIFYSGQLNVPAQLVAIDLAEWKIVVRLPLAPGGSQILPSRDGKLVYVLCRGHAKPKSKPERLGKIFIFDSETGGTMATIMTAPR